MSSSDLEVARNLSRKLAVKAATPTLKAKAAEAKAYLRFSVRRPTTAAESEPSPLDQRDDATPVPVLAVPAPSFPVVETGPVAAPVTLELEDWQALLHWCLAATIAEAGFVVDYEGSVLATEGKVPSDGFEGTGATLCHAMDQLAEVDPTAGKLKSIDLVFGSRTIFGLRVTSELEEDFLLGLVSATPLNNDAKHLVYQQVMHNLPHLD